MVFELHVGERAGALHRQSEFLISQPLEHVQQRERISEHREREVVTAQAKSRHAYKEASECAYEARTGNTEPWRQAPFDLSQRNEISPQAEEGCMAERYETAVAAQK